MEQYSRFRVHVTDDGRLPHLGRGGQSQGSGQGSGRVLHGAESAPAGEEGSSSAGGKAQGSQFRARGSRIRSGIVTVAACACGWARRLGCSADVHMLSPPHAPAGHVATAATALHHDAAARARLVLLPPTQSQGGG